MQVYRWMAVVSLTLGPGDHMSLGGGLVSTAELLPLVVQSPPEDQASCLQRPSALQRHSETARGPLNITSSFPTETRCLKLPRGFRMFLEDWGMLHAPSESGQQSLWQRWHSVVLTPSGIWTWHMAYHRQPQPFMQYKGWEVKYPISKER